MEELKEALEQSKQEQKKTNDLVQETKKRESELVIRLTQKEKDIYNLESLVKLLKDREEKRAVQMRTTYMDPLVNENFLYLQERVTDLEKQLTQKQDELQALSFDPKSEFHQLGQALYVKCKKLQNENDDYGRLLRESKRGRQTVQLAQEKKVIQELEMALSESHEFVMDLDTELCLKQDQIFELKATVQRLKGETPDVPTDAVAVTIAGETQGDGDVKMEGGDATSEAVGSKRKRDNDDASNQAQDGESKQEDKPEQTQEQEQGQESAGHQEQGNET